MGCENEKAVRSIEEWKTGIILAALLGTVFLVLVGSHIASNRYLSVPWLLPEAEGALIGIPAALLIYLSLPKVLSIPYSAVFIERPDRSTLRWTCLGIVLPGGVTFGAIVLLPGTITVQYDGLQILSTILLSAILLGLLAAITEELVFRGYMLSFVGYQWGWPKAIVLTSVLFGVLHNAKVEGTGASELYVLIAASAGLLYALVTYYTENVWNAVALHAMWNTVFHADVLSIRSVDERASEAVITYEYTDSSHLFGADWTAVTGSPFVLLTLLTVSAAVYVTYDEISLKTAGVR
ncbi:CPBP family intramembrane metalloprotease [Natronococcus pandeyae]|uniref:CPBP family intramembrane metalloprotease n=1 Tax=Natronococcus pandeyae TaxID=2055836 RepID=A0A8J8Q461_9EURY|nr:type II CAAX endopeptidase family protein [Natronococcus pandeyae]TYL39965.1 CPBP family intramembrane metalloprotease [Natronococcus pandeyae]